MRESSIAAVASFSAKTGKQEEHVSRDRRKNANQSNGPMFFDSKSIVLLV